MIFSLPDYRHLSEAALERLRKDDGRRSSGRAAGMLFNVLLLAGLWGVPLYGRWVVLSQRAAWPMDLREAIIGKWQKGEKSLLEFTPDQQVRLLVDGATVETASYRLVGDVLAVSSFRLQPGDRDLELNEQRYRISIDDGQLTVTPSAIGFTPVPDNAAWEGSGLRLMLPAFHGASVQFRPVGKH